MDEESVSTNESQELTRFPIVRDSAFVRLSADAFIPWLLGSELEISLLAASPEINGQYLRLMPEAETNIPKLNTGAISPTPTYVEVGRLRVNMAAAQNIASVMITALVANGLATREDFDKVLTSAEAARQSTVNSAH